jgi:hypothetical protein
MDYPILRHRDSNSDLNSDLDRGQDTVRKSPLLSYLNVITQKEKFKYLIIALAITLLIYRLNLSWTIWIGLVIGLLVVYYFNEREAQQLNREGDQLWEVLKSPLLQQTKYFITDPPFIQWVDDISELKSHNVLEFNKMITSLDQLLKLIYNVKRGVYRCKENIDLISDLKVKSLNQFHSLIYKIGNADLIPKYNHYLEQLGYLLNDRHTKLIKICQMYYIMKPIDIDSKFDVTNIDEPVPNDQLNEKNYNFYN